MKKKPLAPPAPLPDESRGTQAWRRGEREGRPGLCSYCEDHWGSGAEHCGGTFGCHETFAGIKSFDEHRKTGACRNPARVPTLAHGGNGTWHLA